MYYLADFSFAPNQKLVNKYIKAIVEDGYKFTKLQGLRFSPSEKGFAAHDALHFLSDQKLTQYSPNKFKNIMQDLEKNKPGFKDKSRSEKVYRSFEKLKEENLRANSPTEDYITGLEGIKLENLPNANLKNYYKGKRDRKKLPKGFKQAQWELENNPELAELAYVMHKPFIDVKPYLREGRMVRKSVRRNPD